MLKPVTEMTSLWMKGISLLKEATRLSSLLQQNNISISTESH